MPSSVAARGMPRYPVLATIVQTITPSSNGIISAQLGNGTALPTLDANVHKYLQVEVKSVGQPDTSYTLLDPTSDSGADDNDRKAMASVAYAQNAESVGSRTIGSASGNILILGPNGRITDERMGTGTTSQTFTINSGDVAGDTSLNAPVRADSQPRARRNAKSRP